MLEDVSTKGPSMGDNRPALPAVMEDAISAVNWGLWIQPSNNSPHTVPGELREILSASDEESSWEAVIRIERACGNSGPGTYYPVVLPAIPILAMIAQNGKEWQSWAAAEILTDWLFSFHPDFKYREIRDPNGYLIDLENAVDTEILKLRPIFEDMIHRTDLSPSKKDWIREVLTGMGEM
jgi:hypothetical protein